MSTKNRGDRIQLLQKVVSKHYTPVPAAEDRSVLEHLLYASCLEDVSYDAADEAFHRLQESFFDWNEVRVTTVSELCETLHNLPHPAAAALRIKKNLQSLFETRYSFEIDDMIKMNQGKAIAELEKLAGMTKFVLGYLTQNALGGHSIPVSNSIMQVLLATEIVSSAEAEKGQTPGLERTVPKTKGAAFASCLHQLAVDWTTQSPSKQTNAIMKEAGATEPRKPAEPTKADKSAAAKAAGGKGAAASVSADKPSSKTANKSPSKTASKPAASTGKGADDTKSTSKKVTAHKPATKKPAESTPPAKKPPVKKSPANKSAPKTSGGSKTTKRKPR